MVVMHKEVISALMLLAAINSPVMAEDVCRGGVPGDTYQWAIALCEVRSGTDDFESPAVQACLNRISRDDKIHPKSGSNCALNTTYKKEWCKQFVEIGRFSSIGVCLKSEEATPMSVRNGYVGS